MKLIGKTLMQPLILFRTSQNISLLIRTAGSILHHLINYGTPTTIAELTRSMSAFQLIQSCHKTESGSKQHYIPRNTQGYTDSPQKKIISSPPQGLKTPSRSHFHGKLQKIGTISRFISTIPLGKSTENAIRLSAITL